MSLYSLKIKDTEFKVAVISDPARMKEGLTNKPALGKTKACCLISRAESYYEHERYELSIGYDFINMSKSSSCTFFEAR
jgi:hypothetical protein